MRKIFLTIFISGVAVSASATIINIPADYTAIQQGINASVDGDTVLVQPGAYYENIDFNSRNITLGSLYLTTGDTTYIGLTAIDGSQSPTSDGHVQFINGEDNRAIITGFTIKNPDNASRGNIYCNGSSPAICYNIIRSANIYVPGGGISCWNYASPIISNNKILDNVVNDIDGGAGIYSGNNCSPVIRDNIISGNTAPSGGGIYCLGNPDVVISDNRIIGNSATYFGGGIFCVTSNAVINNNQIISNRSYFHGAGIYCGGPLPIVIGNNTFTRNVAWYDYGGGKGGGIYCMATDPLIINNSFFNNSADSAGGGLYCRASNPMIINNIFRADSSGWPYSNEINEIFLDSSAAVAEYCNVEGGWPGTGNIDVDPLFRNPADSDFHLMATYCGDSLDSPCIDVGSPYYSDSLLDCSWGLGTTTSDMGAYGGGDTAFVSIHEDVISVPEIFVLLHAYPNPFNAKTTIEFSLAESGDVELNLYDITGAKVETIRRARLKAGRHSIVWDARDTASGVYFARMVAGGEARSIKMVLLK